MHIDDIVEGGETAFGLPDIADQHSTGDDFTTVAAEIGKKVEFPGGEKNLFGAGHRAAVEEIHLEAFPVKDILLTFGFASQEGAEAGQEFGESKRFGEVVVSSGIESGNTVLNFVTGGEQKNGYPLLVGPQFPQKGESFAIGEHPVENHENEALLLPKLPPLGKVAGELWVVAFPAQTLAEIFAEAKIVFNNENGRSIRHFSKID